VLEVRLVSYDENDAAWDDFYEQISSELYPNHKEQAIEKFTADRLRSYYLKYPDVMRPAVLAYNEASKLHDAEYHSAALVFFVTSIELFLKSTLLKPVVYGLVHNDALADVVVQQALSQAGYERYNKLLARLMADMATIDLNEIKREGASKPLLDEAHDVQKIRNEVIHQGRKCTVNEANLAREVASQVYTRIVIAMFKTLGLVVHAKGFVKPA